MPKFKPHLDDNLSVECMHVDHPGHYELGARLRYGYGQVSIEQIAYIKDLNNWEKNIPNHPGISTISMRVSVELLIKAMVLDKCMTKEMYPHVHMSIIRGGLSMANALAMGLTFEQDYTVESSGNNPHEIRVASNELSPGFSADAHGLFMDEEAPRFSVTYIFPQDENAGRGSPLTRSYVDIVQNLNFYMEGLSSPMKTPYSPIIHDLVRAAALSRPNMFPFDEDL